MHPKLSGRFWTSSLIATLFALSLSIGLPSSGWAQEAAEQPEAPAVQSSLGVVSSDHPKASMVGAEILAAGGNAADAGAAALLANGVLNPFASGLGGGGFCLYRPIETGAVHVIDFRETAPLKATEDMFVVDGEPVREKQVRGGLAVAVPGEPAGLWALQGLHGALPWKAVVEPAVTLAESFEVGALLAERLEQRADELEESPELADSYKVDGEWVEQGDTLENPNLAKLLAMYRDEGPIVFYRGAVGDAIVSAVNDAGGVFSSEDFRTYEIAHRQPLQGSYRGFEIYSMPPPSSGGTTLLETLNILEAYDLSERGLTGQTLHLVTEALKHAFADRARWLGDTDFVEVPVERLTSQDYAATLRDKIDPEGVLPLEEYGSHPAPPDDSGTTHLSVIDTDGNMLACTSTINTSFGSMVYVDEYGLVLNNEMGDFTPMRGETNVFGLVGTGQNAVEPKKRPLSSMSPTLVLRDGEPFLSSGASGGPAIITGTLMAILNLVDFGMTPAEAIAAPRIHHQWRPEKLFIEEQMVGQDVLEERGHKLNVRPLWSSVQIVVRQADGTRVGVADPRKKGAPAAEPAADSDKPQKPQKPEKSEKSEQSTTE